MLKEKIICPYCKAEQSDYIEEIVDESYSDSGRECEHNVCCEKCGIEFEVCVQIRYVYSSFPLLNGG